MTLSRNFWIVFRRALLLIVDAIEIELGMPRTADLRKQAKSEFNSEMTDPRPLNSFP